MSAKPPKYRPAALCLVPFFLLSCGYIGDPLPPALNIPRKITDLRVSQQAGRIVAVPHGSLSRSIDFGRGPEPAVIMPWGDVATAYYSTGIPNIETYFAVKPSAIWLVPIRAIAFEVRVSKRGCGRWTLLLVLVRGNGSFGLPELRAYLSM